MAKLVVTLKDRRRMGSHLMNVQLSLMSVRVGLSFGVIQGHSDFILHPPYFHPMAFNSVMHHVSCLMAKSPIKWENLAHFVDRHCGRGEGPFTHDACKVFQFLYFLVTVAPRFCLL